MQQKSLGQCPQQPKAVTGGTQLRPDGVCIQGSGDGMIIDQLQQKVVEGPGQQPGAPVSNFLRINPKLQ